MIKTLIVYDTTGYILSIVTDSYHIPTGVPFLEVEIPNGKRLSTVGGIGVDVSKTPHQVILEDIPPSEIDILKEENVRIKQSMAELAELILGGM